MKQAAPECEISASNNQIYVRVAGGSEDSLSDVINSAHNEFRWAWDREGAIFVEQTSVNVVRPD